MTERTARLGDVVSAGQFSRDVLRQIVVAFGIDEIVQRQHVAIANFGRSQLWRIDVGPIRQLLALHVSHVVVKGHRYAVQLKRRPQ